MAVLAICLYDWRWSLGVFALRFIWQGVVLYRSMSKLGEGDLWPWYLFLDMWMFFYYLIFAPALWRRPTRSWN
jgi:hypothetical protein